MKFLILNLTLIISVNTHAKFEVNNRQVWPESLKQATSLLMKMEMKQNCKRVTVDQMPMLDCEYQTSYPDRKWGKVLLLDISQEKWMSWIGNACAAISQNNKKCYDAVVQRIRHQSGGQIPWQGIVFEDIKPRDGVNEMYCFRHGISIAIHGLPRWLTRQPTAQEIRLCYEGLDIYFVGKMPRPISLTVQEFQTMTGEKGMADSKGEGTLLWLSRISEVLQLSMQDPRNLFIDLWVRKYVRP